MAAFQSQGSAATYTIFQVNILIAFQEQNVTEAMKGHFEACQCWYKNFKNFRQHFQMNGY